MGTDNVDEIHDVFKTDKERWTAALKIREVLALEGIMQVLNEIRRDRRI